MRREPTGRAHDPFFWRKQAKDLDFAAMLIWAAIRQDFEALSGKDVGSTVSLCDAPLVNLGGVFWLNAGLALENLLKGIIIRQEPESVVNGAVPRSLRTHNLTALARRAAITFDPIDAFFLWVGTESVTWAGRYPCANAPGRTGPPVFSESDVLGYRRLFDRLEKKVPGKDGGIVGFTRLA